MKVKKPAGRRARFHSAQRKLPRSIFPGICSQPAAPVLFALIGLREDFAL